MATMAILKYLGAPRVIRGGTDLEMDAEIRKGFPVASLVEFKRRTGFTAKDLAFLLDISPKTMERAIATRARLNPSASDRLYRAARIIALADEVFEDADQARGWLRAPQHGLGGRIPFDLLSTEAGAAEVEHLLRRIEHGFVA